MCLFAWQKVILCVSETTSADPHFSVANARHFFFFLFLFSCSCSRVSTSTLGKGVCETQLLLLRRKHDGRRSGHPWHQRRTLARSLARLSNWTENGTEAGVTNGVSEHSVNVFAISAERAEPSSVSQSPQDSSTTVPKSPKSGAATEGAPVGFSVKEHLLHLGIYAHTKARESKLHRSVSIRSTGCHTVVNREAQQQQQSTLGLFFGLTQGDLSAGGPINLSPFA